MRHLVLRRINGSDKEYLPGQEVDATKWRHEQLLVEQKKLAPIPDHSPTKKELARPNVKMARFKAQQLKAHLAPPKVGKQEAVKETV